ncbi:MAG: FkbM family methyltransferase [Candidatus Pelagibacter sp.]
MELKKYKKLPIIKRLYPSIVKKIYNLFGKNEIYFQYFDTRFKGNINEPIDKEIYLFNDYESEQIKILIKELNKKKYNYFLDIGANLGLYSLIVSNKFSNIKIKSFEPISNSIIKFKENIKLNPNSKNIEIFEYGLSDQNTKLLMKSYKKKNYIQLGGFGVASKGENLNNLFTSYANFRKGDEILKIENESLVVKIDTEGHEEQVINGLKKIMIKNNVLLQVEIFIKNYERVNNLLTNLNFRKVSFVKNLEKIDYFYKNF